MKRDEEVFCPACHCSYLQSYLRRYGGTCASCAVKIDKEKEENRNTKITEIIAKYSEAEEIVENGQRFLQTSFGEKIPFGHPYPATREKYILNEIRPLLNSRTV